MMTNRWSTSPASEVVPHVGHIDGLSEALRVYASNDVLTVVGLETDSAVTTYTKAVTAVQVVVHPGADGTWYLGRGSRKSAVFSPEGRQQVRCPAGVAGSGRRRRCRPAAVRGRASDRHVQRGRILDHAGSPGRRRRTEL
jgi:hypothetical protein